MRLSQLKKINEQAQFGEISHGLGKKKLDSLALRYNRGIEKYLQYKKNRTRSWQTEVYILVGKPGIGKSRFCQDNAPDAYWKRKGEWWCGYDLHESVVLDEYYGWLPLDTMLRIMDRYPLMVETKGGAVNFVAKRLFITSNVAWENWYKWPNEDLKAAFQRRISHVIELPLSQPLICLNKPKFEIY